MFEGIRNRKNVPFRKIFMFLQWKSEVWARQRRRVGWGCPRNQIRGKLSQRKQNLFLFILFCFCFFFYFRYPVAQPRADGVCTEPGYIFSDWTDSEHGFICCTHSNEMYILVELIDILKFRICFAIRRDS